MRGITNTGKDKPLDGYRLVCSKFSVVRHTGCVVMKNRLPNFEMIGYVINDKHPKTVRVACDRYMYVMRYKKSFRYTKKIWAHDEHSEAKLGDIVQVQPLGYRIGPWKTYVLRKIIHKEGSGGNERLRGSVVRNMAVKFDKTESLEITKLPSSID